MALKVERVAVVATAAAAVVVVAWNWGRYEGGDRGGAGLSSTIHCGVGGFGGPIVARVAWPP